jgi:hypothetical protein
MKLITIVVTLFLAAYSCCASAQQLWVYTNPASPVNYFIIQTSPGGVGLGDALDTAEFCKPGDQYACFASPALEFSVPHNLSKTTSSWEVRGKKYTIESIKVRRYLGIAENIYRITAKLNGTTMYYLYSRHRGLMGFGGIAADGKAGVFLLESKCGFAAAADCVP